MNQRTATTGRKVGVLELILFLLAMLFAGLGPLFGQTGTTKNTAVTQVIDLRAEYDLWPSDAKLTLRDVFTIEQAKVKYPALFTKRAQGCKDRLTDAEVMELTLFEAAHTDALFRNADLIDVGDPTLAHGVLIGSSNTILWPPGGYAVTRPIEYAKGTIEGAGAGVGNIEYGGRGGTTEIEPWLERWKGDPRNVMVMRSAHHGSNNVYAYSEATRIRGFRINGRAGKWHDPNRSITGLNCWDMGEASDVTDLFIYQCDTGLNIVRGTPFTSSGCISLFSNNAAGLALTGGGTVHISTLSGDDNARMVHSRPGYGRPASCRMNIGAVKSEWLVTDATYGRTPKPNTWELEGWIRLNIGVFSHAIGNAYQDALFVVKPDVNTSHIRVSDFTLFAFSNLDLLLRDRVNREAWDFDNGFGSRITSFDWYSDAGGFLESKPTQAPRIDYPFTGPQLGYLKGDPATGQPIGSFDRVNGSPSWSDVTGSSSAPVAPPSPCSYTYSTWGACVNGTQTRTVTAATPAGCTGSPVLSQPCTATAPKLVFASTFGGTSATRIVATTGTTITSSATWSGFAAAPNGTATTTSNTSFPWTGSASRVVLLGVTFTNAPGPGLYPMVTGSHVLYPDGRIFHRAGGKDTFLGVTVAKGQRIERLDLSVPDGVLPVLLGGPVGLGSSPGMTVEGIEVYQ